MQREFTRLNINITDAVSTGLVKYMVTVTRDYLAIPASEVVAIRGYLIREEIYWLCRDILYAQRL